MNKSQIAKALREAAFSPGKQGPLKIIADVGNINYYIRRAMEFLTLSLTALTPEQKVEYFNNALSMIALAKVKTQEIVPVTIGNINRAASSPLKVVATDILVKEQNDGDLPAKMRSREEVFGEVDIEKQGRQIHSPSDSVPARNLSRDIHEDRRGIKSKKPILKEVQLWPETQKEEADREYDLD